MNATILRDTTISLTMGLEERNLMDRMRGFSSRGLYIAGLVQEQWTQQEALLGTVSPVHHDRTTTEHREFITPDTGATPDAGLTPELTSRPTPKSKEPEDQIPVKFAIDKLTVVRIEILRRETPRKVYIMSLITNDIDPITNLAKTVTTLLKQPSGGIPRAGSSTIKSRLGRPKLYQDRTIITLTLERDVLNLIDTLRGDLGRSHYISNLVLERSQQKKNIPESQEIKETENKMLYITPAQGGV